MQNGGEEGENAGRGDSEPVRGLEGATATHTKYFFGPMYTLYPHSK